MNKACNRIEPLLGDLLPAVALERTKQPDGG